MKETNMNEANAKETNEKEANGKEINGKAINQRRKRKGLLAPVSILVLAVLCSLLSLCLPAVFARMQDTAVLSRELPRPAQESTLDERARDIPLVYALYRRRYLVSPTFPSTIQNDGTGDGTALLQMKLSELTQAGVLPEAPAQQIQELLSIPPLYTGCDTGGDFSAAEQGSSTKSLSEPGGLLSEPADELSVMLYWHTDTGLIVSLQASVDASKTDANELLRRYRAYLGLDVLDDWMAVDLESEAKAACFSPTGQLYLYCFAQERELALGAVSLSLEEMTETFLQ